MDGLPTPACPTLEELERFLADRPASNRSGGSVIGDHLSSCPHCRQRADSLSENNALLRGYLPRDASSLGDLLPLTAPSMAEARRVVGAGDETLQAPRRGLSAGPGSLTVPGFTLLRELGRGGMGAVFEAEQFHPRRHVALKVIRPGAVSREAMRRFEHEVQVLARLQHTGIAQIFEAGAIGDGTDAQPYFAMELIRGQPLAQYCIARRLSVHERVLLLARICDAVQHAHQKGVIHRDLKPANVLVDERGEPKILDFGVARLTEPDAQQTLLTAGGALIGTVAYMSPEQAGGPDLPTDIDTRSDVYTLGVIGFELLSGRLPNEARGKPVHEVIRSIREDDSPRLGALNGALRGDLEIIFAKALEKDRDQRYATAEQLAGDLRRYLAHEPISARRPSVAYQARKFARRHTGWVVGLGSAAVMLVAGVIAVARYALIANEQRKAAVLASKESEQTSDFMRGLLDGAGPAVAQGRDPTILRGLLDAAARRIAAGDLGDSPRSELRLRQSIAAVYRDIDALDAARELLDPALPLARSQYGDESSNVAMILGEQAVLLQAMGKLEEALALHRQAHQQLTRIHGADPALIALMMNNIGWCLNKLSRYDEALPLLTEATTTLEQLRLGDDRGTAQARDNLAETLLGLGRLTDALPHYEAALAMRQRLFPGDHPYVMWSLNNVALCLNRLGRDAEALAAQEAALEMSKRLHGGEAHSSVAAALKNVAAILVDLGRGEDAVRKFEEALAIMRRVHPGDHPYVAILLNDLGDCLGRLGRQSEALPLHDEALAMNERLFAGDHLDIARSLILGARSQSELGRPNEALPKYDRALDMFRRLFGESHPNVATALNDKAHCLRDAGREEDALPAFEAALAIYRRALPPEHPYIALALNNVAVCLRNLGRNEEALKTHEAVLAMRQQRFAGDHPDVAESLNNLGSCLRSLDRLPESLERHQAALAIYQRVFSGDHPRIAITLSNIASVLNQLGRVDEAVTTEQSALAIRRRLYPAGHQDTAFSLEALASFAEKQTRLDEAHSLLSESLAMHRRVLDPDDPRIAASLLRLGRVMHLQGKSAEAEPLLRECLTIRDKAYPDGHALAWRRHDAAGLLGEIVSAQGRFAEAEPLLLAGFENMSPPPASAARRREALQRLVAFYDAWDAADPGRGFAGKAAGWRSRLVTSDPPVTAPAPE